LTKVSLKEDIQGLDIQVDGVSLVIDERLHQAVEGGFETLGAISPKIEEVFDQLALTIGTILDSSPGLSDPIEMYLDGLKGAIVNYHLLFTLSSRQIY